MSFLIDLVTLPALGLGAPSLVHWLAKTLVAEAESQALDEERVRADLLELQERYEAGEMPLEEYDRQEKALVERLNTIRELKAQQDHDR